MNGFNYIVTTTKCQAAAYMFRYYLYSNNNTMNTSSTGTYIKPSVQQECRAATAFTLH